MFNYNKTYTFFNEGKVPAKNGAVVLYRTSNEDSRLKKITAVSLLVASIGVTSLQVGFVLNASASDNPISSPVTTPEIYVCPQGSISKVINGTIICISQTQGQQQQNNNQNSNSGNSTSNTNNNNPVTSPEVSPTPTSTPAPVTSPEITTPTTQPSGSNSSNGGNNGSSSNNGGGSNSAPSCNNEAPKAPKIVSAITSGKNDITLTWDKPQGPVTHYSVAYGVVKNKPLYGASNVGNVTSFKIKGLSGGGTYFFTVKAVNDCTPSAASNEVGVKVGGQFISTPAQGFKPGVLGKNIKVATQPSKLALSKPVIFSPITENLPSTGLVGKVFNFFKNIF